jgi:hypothetical protein
MIKQDLTWSDEQIQRLLQLREEGKTFVEISKQFRKEFGVEVTHNAIKKAFYRYRDTSMEEADTIDALRVSQRAKVSKAKVLKENKLLVDYLNQKEDLFQSLIELIETAKFTKPIQVKPKFDKKKKKAVLEIMLSDLHYGKKSKTFNSVVARDRMKQMTTAVLGEIERYSKLYNVTEIITFLGGDMIENADFHGKESMRASEFSTSQQVSLAIESLYEDYFVPVCARGMKHTVICIAGNHSRPDEFKSYQDPGEIAHSWVLYNALQLLCKAAKFKNMKFHIERGVYYVHKIFNTVVLYEHGDYIKGRFDRGSFESHMAKRSKQINTLIDCLRMGHFHEYTQFGRGKIIVNASLCGQDSYSEINGYSSEAGQTINIYVETENRPNNFYHSFPVYLK